MTNFLLSLINHLTTAPYAAATLLSFTSVVVMLWWWLNVGWEYKTDMEDE